MTLDAYIAERDRRPLAKAAPFTEEEVGEELDRRLEATRQPAPDDFPRTRDGFIAFTGSAPMLRLLLDDPSRYETLAASFLESLPSGAAMPQEVSMWMAQMQAWRRAMAELPSERKKEMAKALPGHHRTPLPQPWSFHKTTDGLMAFIQSGPMQTLRRRDANRYKHECLQFATQIAGHTPQDISQLRQRLERDASDAQVVAKAFGGLHDSLTAGQAIIKQNFGFDPSEWLRPR